jgi:ABC-type Zn2+ transport system substrate-binding protein/surface adhesin
MRSPSRLAAAMALTATLAAAVATGCSGSDAADDRFTVVAAFYPLRFLADRLAGDRADVVDLVKPGASSRLSMRRWSSRWIRRRCWTWRRYGRC